MRGRRNLGAAAGALVLMLGLSGCWPVVNQGPDRSAYNATENGITPDTVNRLTVAWSRTTAGNVPAEIVASPSRVVVTTPTALQVLNLSDGLLAWLNSGTWLTPSVEGGEVTASQSSITAGQSSTRFDEATGAVLGTTTAGQMESRRARGPCTRARASLRRATSRTSSRSSTPATRTGTSVAPTTAATSPASSGSRSAPCGCTRPDRA
jgi:hypothetical protein